jgi:hypothetical protein
MQTARHLIRVLVKLPPGMQRGHDHLESRSLLFGMQVHRDPASIIPDCNGSILVDGHQNSIAVTCERLVNGVVHHLVDQVMKTAHTHIADIHGGAFTNGFQPFEDLDIRSAVFFLLGSFSHKK